MPTNLPPEYYEVEKLYRAAQTPQERIRRLEELISTVPKHKGTDHLRANLRRQLSKLKETAESKKGGGGYQSEFYIEPEGAGQVVLVGPANVGKSALLAALTNAEPEINAAPYTTWRPTPGMLQIDNIQVQLIDTPPLDREFIEPQFIELIRRADEVAIVVDLQTYPIRQMDETLAILREYRILPLVSGGESPEDRRFYVKPVLIMVNKCDDDEDMELFETLCALLDSEPECPLLPVSAVSGYNFERLKTEIFRRLDVIRVYTQAPGREPDFSRPFVLKQGSTVNELARKIHKDFYDNFKSARVWGSAAFDGQMVQRDYILQDGDIVELKA